MSWEVFSRRGVSTLQIGNFKAKKISSTWAIPEHLKGKTLNFYIDRKEKIVKIEPDKKESSTSEHFSVISLEKLFKSDMTIVYLGESAMYVSDYNEGQEKLERFLKREGVI